MGWLDLLMDKGHARRKRRKRRKSTTDAELEFLRENDAELYGLLKALRDYRNKMRTVKVGLAQTPELRFKKGSDRARAEEIAGEARKYIDGLSSKPALYRDLKMRGSSLLEKLEKRYGLFQDDAPGRSAGQYV